MTLRFVVACLPMMLGYVGALYFHSRALDYLRTPIQSRWIRYLRIMSASPLDMSAYQLEAARYRGYALLSMALGIGGTILLVLLLQPGGGA